MVDRQFSIEKRSSVPMAPVAPAPERKWISSETEDNKESSKVYLLEEIFSFFTLSIKLLNKSKGVNLKLSTEVSLLGG